MASKARHLASLLSDESRGVDVGNASAKIKEEKSSFKNRASNKISFRNDDDDQDILSVKTNTEKVGILTDNPQAVLDVEGDIRVGTDLEDNSGRVFKVYQANGSIAWGE